MKRGNFLKSLLGIAIAPTAMASVELAKQQPTKAVPSFLPKVGQVYLQSQEVEMPYGSEKKKYENHTYWSVFKVCPWPEPEGQVVFLRMLGIHPSNAAGIDESALMVNVNEFDKRMTPQQVLEYFNNAGVLIYSPRRYDLTKISFAELQTYKLVKDVD